MFMTKFKDGSFTNFEDKIIKSIDPDYKNQLAYRNLILNGIVMPIICPKKHTIRRSARMKVGTKLSMRQWTGLPYRSKQREFARGECTGIQKIHIWQDSFGGRYVVIDDRDEILTDNQVSRLAVNDGFETVDQFFSWFGFDFTGYIIHWSDLKY